MTLNFNKVLVPGLSQVKTALLNTVMSEGTALQRQAAVAALASDYRNGAVLAGVTLPTATGGTLAPLDEILIGASGEELYEATVRSYPTMAQYLRSFEDELSSPVYGRRVVASCALICFLVREAS